MSSVFQLSSSLAKFRPHLNRNANLSFLVKEVSFEQIYLIVLFHLNTLIFFCCFSDFTVLVSNRKEEYKKEAVSGKCEREPWFASWGH